MKKNIPYIYYRCALVATWIMAFLTIIGTWLTFLIGGNPSATFGITTDAFLLLAMVLLSTLLFISDRPNYHWKGLIVAILAAAHVVFCTAVLIVEFKSYDIDRNPLMWYLCPSIHTAILLCVGGFGVYFTLRDRFVFKHPSRADAAAAFGGKVSDDPIPPSTTAPRDPNKPARDEKTGIVSL